jgi:hypothetical protein
MIATRFRFGDLGPGAFEGKRRMPALSFRQPPSLRPIKTGPPPLPVAARHPPSATFIDQTVDDIERLASDIERVLAGRSHVRPVHEPSLSAAIAAGVALADGRGALGHETGAFDWQAPDGRRRPAEQPTEPTGSWLTHAKRERRFAAVRSALSWAVAAGVVAVIVAVSVMLVGGTWPHLSDVENAVRTLGW